MLETPQITTTTPQPTALIHLTVPRDQIQHVMGPGITEVMAVVTAQGLTPTGPWFTHHFRLVPDVFDFEICVPVAGTVTPSGRVKAGQRPALRVARTIYQGPYEGLGPAWGEFDAWIAANGHRPAGDVWEYYVKGPESSPEPSDWQTELHRPLLG